MPAPVRSARCRLFTAATMTVAAALVPAPIAAGFPGLTDQTGVVQLADQTLADYLANRLPTPRLVHIASGTSLTSPCPDSFGDTAQHDRSFDYCPTDNTVYVGQERLADVDRQYGTAALLSGIAHEYGHAIQAAKGVPAPATAADTIRHEDQADCVSGDFVDYLGERGILTLPDDLMGIRRYLTATASADLPGRTHGTAEERIRSFTLGYEGGLSACSQFYPATPLGN